MQSQNFRPTKVLSMLSLAAAAGLAFVTSPARAVTLTSYYANAIISSVSPIAKFNPLTLGVNATQVDISAASPTLTCPVGDFVQFGIAAAVTNNINPAGGYATDNGLGGSIVQPTNLGLADIGYRVLNISSNDLNASILAPVQGALRSSVLNEYFATDIIGGRGKVAAGSNASAYGQNPYVLNTIGFEVTDSGDTEPNVGTVANTFQIFQGNANTDGNTTAHQLVLTQFAPGVGGNKNPHNATLAFDTLSYQAVSGGVVTLQPAVDPGATQYWGNTAAQSYTSSSPPSIATYGARFFSSTDTIHPLPVLTIVTGPAVPEPASLAILALGSVAMLKRRRAASISVDEQTLTHPKENVMQLKKNNSVKTLATLSIAASAGLGVAVSQAPAATLTSYYANAIISTVSPTATGAGKLVLGTNATQVDVSAASPGITVPVGDYVQFGIAAVVINNINRDAGRATSNGVGGTIVQPTNLGLAEISYRVLNVSANDLNASILAPVESQPRPTSPGEFFTTAVLGGEGKVHAGSSLSAYPQNPFVTTGAGFALGDVGDTEAGVGTVANVFQIWNGSPTATGTSLQSQQLLTQYAPQQGASLGDPHNATLVFDTLSYQALAGGTVTLQPAVDPTALLLWTNTQAGTSSTPSAYHAAYFSSTDTISSLPVLTITIGPAVPEPLSSGILSLGAAGLLNRRRTNTVSL
jgi:hypothetical protein